MGNIRLIEKTLLYKSVPINLSEAEKKKKFTCSVHFRIKNTTSDERISSGA